MGKAKTHFEQIPLEVVKQVAQEETLNAIHCAICDLPVNLEKCKVDESGGAVHEDCYFNKLSHYPVSRTRVK